MTTRHHRRPRAPAHHAPGDEVTDELTALRRADAAAADDRRAERATRSAAAYLAARRRRLRRQLQTGS